MRTTEEVRGGFELKLALAAALARALLLCKLINDIVRIPRLPPRDPPLIMITPRRPAVITCTRGRRRHHMHA